MRKRGCVKFGLLTCVRKGCLNFDQTTCVRKGCLNFDPTTWVRKGSVQLAVSFCEAQVTKFDESKTTLDKAKWMKNSLKKSRKVFVPAVIQTRRQQRIAATAAAVVVVRCR